MKTQAFIQPVSQTLEKAVCSAGLSPAVLCTCTGKEDCFVFKWSLSAENA